MAAVPTLGLDLAAAPQLEAALHAQLARGFGYVCVPIAHPRLKRRLAMPVPGGAAAARTAWQGAEDAAPFTRSDLLLPSDAWTTQVVGKLSEWARLDSPHEAERRNSADVLRQEAAFAAHLSLPAVLLPRGAYLAETHSNLARLVFELLQQSQCPPLWLPLPLCASRCRDGAAHPVDTWAVWDRIRTLCDHHPRLSLVLEVTEDLPAPAEVARWLAEPVRALAVHTRLFLTGVAGAPRLSRSHAQLMRRFAALPSVQLILRGRVTSHHAVLRALFEPASGEAEASKEQQQGEGDDDDEDDASASGDELDASYADYLQAPLQPLQDNLESQTYETFERDAIKYAQYEAAVARVLRALPAAAAGPAPAVVMVLGAGRGPLVQVVLRAAAAARRGVRVYAVEKNPNAVVTLRNLKHALWRDAVTVVAQDMRAWQAPELADVVVSELLGSFGDNELSPECLDGALRLLKPGGVSVPSDSLSYLAPVAAHKLWAEINAAAAAGGGGGGGGGSWLKGFETPYVVKLRAAHSVSAPQPCFLFRHPNRAGGDGNEPLAPLDNQRFARLRFAAARDSVVHGLAGYFEARLFGDEVTLSTLPATHTPNMQSWFPLFFPLRHPVHVRAGAALEVCLWRVVGASRVWYEWCLEGEHATPLHNPAGRSSFIGL
jgi:protein arginine N-methyltransferase 5